MAIDISWKNLGNYDCSISYCSDGSNEEVSFAKLRSPIGRILLTSYLQRVIY